MKTKFKDIGLLDMRGMTAEQAREIDSLEDIGVVLLAEQNRALFQQLRAKDVGAVLCLPEGVRLLRVNGAHRIEADTGDSAPVYLSVNGTLDVAPDVAPEQLRARVVGGHVNGRLTGTASQLAALSACGLSVNGQHVAYPDGCTRREERSPIELAEARRLTGKVFQLHRVELKEGVLPLLAQNGVTLYGNSGLIFPQADRDALAAVWQGAGALLEIPQGFRYVPGDLVIDARNAYRLRGKLMVGGDFALREALADAALEPLEALRVLGEALVPARFADAVLARLLGEPDMQVYEGTLLRNEGTLDLTREMLDALPETVTLQNKGMLTISEDIPAELLRQRVRLLLNNGMVSLTAAQHGALLPNTVDRGQMETAQPEAEPTEEITDPNVVLIQDLGEYAL